jgi:subtilisin family serine protease
MLSSRRAISIASIFARNLCIAVAVLSITMSTTPLPGMCEEGKGQMDKKPTVGKSIKKPAPEDVLIVRLNRGADRDEFNQTLQEVNGTFLRTIDVTPEVKLLVIQTEPGQAAEVEKKLKGKKDVASVERNKRYTVHYTSAPASSGSGYTGQSAEEYKGGLVATSLAPNDPFFFAQWDLMALGYPQGRLLAGPTGQFIPIYFLDTGMSYFPGESSIFAGQFNFSDPVNPTGAFEQMFDSGFHGTATSSVTCNSDNGIGIAGAANFEANHCMVYMLRISQDGESSTLVDILSALSFILQDPLCKGGPINISFGSNSGPSLNTDPNLQLLAYYLYYKGCLVVLAAGNNGLEDPSPEVFCRRVAATDSNNNLATFSTFGPSITAAAPGVNVPVYIPSLGPGQPVYASGTSFSAPRWCSAILAVMAACKNPGNRNAPFADSVIRSTATSTSGGLMIPNFQAAIQAANKD